MSDHFIWNLLNEPNLASEINLIWNDHKCKILFIIWPLSMILSPSKFFISGPRQQMLAELCWAPPTNVGGALLFSACPSVCPSIRLSMVTLTQSTLIRFLPNFIYGLLQSTSRSRSNRGFVRHPITRWLTKWQPPISIRFCGHSSSVIFNQISSKFYIWIAFINLSFKFEYGFCSTSCNQDGQQNGRRPSVFIVVVTLTQSFSIGFLPNFIYGLLSSTSHSSSNMGFVQHPIIKMADKMAATYQYPLSWSL